MKNRIAKSAMSDSLGDGRGNPTPAQIRLYERWAEGGAALTIIGEVQGDPSAAEKPGNLVLGPLSDKAMLRELASRGGADQTQLWCQLGHAGAMAHPPIGDPRGPSALDLPGLTCRSLTLDEIATLPAQFAGTAARAKSLGFGGIQIHAAHGFLLSQFLSPLFNKRTDQYGGSLAHQMRILLEVIDEVRDAVGPDYPIGLKLNATDQLEGGFDQAEALETLKALETTSLDLIDISGGTYFPGAKSASDRAGGGPYFTEFGKLARSKTTKPLMITGGFKTAAEAKDAISTGAADIVGLARAFIIAPDLPRRWKAGKEVRFPRFEDPPEGGVTAWYTQAITELGNDRALPSSTDVAGALAAYNARDADRINVWNTHFC